MTTFLCRLPLLSILFIGFSQFASNFSRFGIVDLFEFLGYRFKNLSPVRVRVETMNGIQTVTESESSTVMKFKQ